ncbi:MAG: B12-binding domain-containing radical SAM protein [Syntrophobacteraceae bacterium]
MRVYLIYPGWPDNYWPQGAFRSHWVPTGLAHIAYVLEKEGCEVRVLNCEEHLIKNSYNRAAVDELIKGELREFAPDLVGLSILTPGMIEAARIANFVKRICGADTIVIAGGPHPTALPQRTLREIPELDAVVVGEGELTMLDLIKSGISDDIAGLVFRRGNELAPTRPGPRQKDLDELGLPAYHLFDMNFYTEPNRWMIPWLNVKATNIRTSRGCVGSCWFCAGPLVSGPGVRFHSIDHVIDQVKYVVKEFGVEAIHFEDDSIGADPDRLVSLCEALRNSGLNKIRWDCCLRVDQARPELLNEMKSAGCIMVEYGIETGSEKMLTAIGKKSTLDLNRRAVEITRKAGLRIFTDIMLGLPGETEKDWDETVGFLRWAKPDIIRAGLLCPLPGTALFNQLPRDVQDSIRWEGYTYMDTLELGLIMSSLPKEEVRSRFRNLNKYFLGPHVAWGVLRDSNPTERELRRALWKKIISFALRHPVRAARLPNRWAD